jgi:hypothetical protein
LGPSYQHYFSSPHIVSQDKINCAIIFDNCFDFELIRVEINYISIILRNPPLQEQTLFIALYLNPTLEEKHYILNEETLDHAAQDINMFFSRKNQANPSIIVAGDFNMDKKDM